MSVNFLTYAQNDSKLEDLKSWLIGELKQMAQSEDAEKRQWALGQLVQIVMLCR